MGDLTALTYAPVGATPSWQGSLPAQLTFRCVHVDEPNVASRTDTVRCIQSVDPMPNQLVGTRLAKPTLDGIIAALGQTSFPDNGLVVGVVLDKLGNPAGGLIVTTTDGTIKYLAANRLSMTGTMTSTNGIFVSDDAAFGATFSAMSGGQTAKAIGGLIDGKVTIVVLQIPDQTGE
jgi:hypothetical protein